MSNVHILAIDLAKAKLPGLWHRSGWGGSIQSHAVAHEIHASWRRKPVRPATTEAASRNKAATMSGWKALEEIFPATRHQRAVRRPRS